MSAITHSGMAHRPAFLASAGRMRGAGCVHAMCGISSLQKTLPNHFAADPDLERFAAARPERRVFVAVHLGWQWVFIILSAFVALMLAVCWWLLPQGHQPDRSVSLRFRPIFDNYATVLKEPQFITYALSGAFAFSGLLVYVASAPIIFMEVFHVSPQKFSAIFAALSVGFIGSNQVNVLLLRKFSSEQIFRATLLIECPVALLFLVERCVVGLAWSYAGAVVHFSVQPGPGLSERRAGAGTVRTQYRQCLRHAGLPADRRLRPGVRQHRYF